MRHYKYAHTESISPIDIHAFRAHTEACSLQPTLRTSVAFKVRKNMVLLNVGTYYNNQFLGSRYQGYNVHTESSANSVIYNENSVTHGDDIALNIIQYIII